MTTSITYHCALRVALCACVLFIPKTLHAQTEDAGKTEVRITADSFVGRDVAGESVRELIGNVHLIQESTELWSDRAVQWLDRDEIRFTGNVLLVEEGDSVRANTMLYNRQTKIGRADGQVELSDGDVRVTAPTAIYETESKYAVFTDGVSLQDSTSTLQSLQGEYWSEDKRALFVGSVILEKETSILRADTVDYFRDTEVAKAQGSVIVEEFEKNNDSVLQEYTVIFGANSESSPRDSTFIVGGDVLLMSLARDSAGVLTDTLVVASNQLKLEERPTHDVVEAIGDARIWSAKLRSISASARYESHDLADQDKVWLSGSPITWYDDAQMSGDSISFSEQPAIDSVWVTGNAFLARWDSTTAKIHQVQANRIVGGGTDSSNVLTVFPDAEAIYFLSGEKSGGVQVTADRIVFNVSRGDLKKVDAIGGVEGTYYPKESLPAVFQLSRFIWQPEAEPKSELFLRDLRYTVAKPFLLISSQ